jgi:hypothetical protein
MNISSPLVLSPLWWNPGLSQPSAVKSNYKFLLYMSLQVVDYLGTLIESENMETLIIPVGTTNKGGNYSCINL